MPRIAYRSKKFSAKSLETIEHANAILTDFRSQGYDLTLRQLYYQFVSQDLIANKQSEYKRLGDIISDARLCGLVDWMAIVDRTRNLMSFGSSNEDIADIFDSAKYGFRVNPWEEQDAYVEAWIEKDALAGVLERACGPQRVNYFSCRGYTSASEMWAASQRLIEKIEEGKTVTILHLGDHDPSGKDMTRDIQDRLTEFGVGHLGREFYDNFEVKRLALNMDQINEYGPPPNPAKLSDSRAPGYVAEFGYESWELDALPPSVISELVREAVEELIDRDRWDASEQRQQDGRDKIEEIIEKIREDEI